MFAGSGVAGNDQFFIALKVKHLSLPLDAKIQGMALHRVKPKVYELNPTKIPPERALAECEGFHLTEAQVRDEFRTYRVVTEDEQSAMTHENPCAWEGVVVAPGGKQFHFEISPDHLLRTDWAWGLTSSEVVLGGGPELPPLIDHPTRIVGTAPPLSLQNEDDDVIYLIGAGEKPLHIATSREWPTASPLFRWLKPYRAKMLGGVPGQYIVYTESFASNEWDSMGHCANVGTEEDTLTLPPPSEVFLHVVSIGTTPRETFNIQVESCLFPEDFKHARWNQQTHTLLAYIRDQLSPITFHVGPEGKLTPFPPKPAYSK